MKLIKNLRLSMVQKIVLAFLILVSIIPQNPITVLDATTGESLTNAFRLEMPYIKYFIEPYVGIPLFLNYLNDPISKIVSCMIWVFVVYVLIRMISLIRLFRTKKPVGFSLIFPYLGNSILGLSLVTFSVFLFILYSLFIPLPAYKLISLTPDEVLIDTHTHTIYSHDGFLTPEENIQWHVDRGFKAMFVTDHWDIKGALKTMRVVNNNRHRFGDFVVLPGEELPSSPHVLLVGVNRKYDSSRNNLPEVIDEVHREGGIVIVPHYWRSKGSTVEKLAEFVSLGVDGFEVSKSGNSFLEDEIIRQSKNHELLMLAGSDHHGWGSAALRWTAVHIPEWNSFSGSEKQNVLLNSFTQRKWKNFEPIIAEQKQLAFRGRSLVEPIFVLYYYFASLNLGQILSWLAWTVILTVTWRWQAASGIKTTLSRYRNTAKWIVVLLISIVLICSGWQWLRVWKSVSEYNKILAEYGKILIGVGLGYCLLAAGMIGIFLKKERLGTENH